MGMNRDDKEKERLEKAANYPWAEIVGEFEMTKEEKEQADKDLLRIIKEFDNKRQKK